MTRQEKIEAAVEIIVGSMQEMGYSDKEIRKEAEQLTDEQLDNYLAEA